MNGTATRQGYNIFFFNFIIFFVASIKHNKIYSQERKDLVLAAARSPKNNFSIRNLSILFSVSKSTIHRWLSVLPCTADTQNNGNKAIKISKTDSIKNHIRYEIIKNPFTCCRILKQILNEKYSIIVSIELVRLVIKTLTYRKIKAQFYGRSKNQLQLNAALKNPSSLKEETSKSIVTKSTNEFGDIIRTKVITTIKTITTIRNKVPKKTM